jgi:hypothetical protein
VGSHAVPRRHDPVRLPGDRHAVGLACAPALRRRYGGHPGARPGTSTQSH